MRGQSGRPQESKAYKQFYRQQLDDLVSQRDHERRMKREQQQRQKQTYNQRIGLNMEAERLKDISYKNYYNVLINNQTNNSRLYVPYDEKGIEKDKHILQGVEEDKIRSQALHELQQRKAQMARKNYREQLANQINEKYNRQNAQMSAKVRQNQQFRSITYVPQELAKYERQRKLLEMQKYKQDLDQTSVPRRDRSITNPNYTSTSNNAKNEFNLQYQNSHNPLVNPLPFNIQNPYILRQMNRGSQYHEEHSPSKPY